MMKIRKIAALLMVAAMAMSSLTACGGSDSNAETVKSAGGQEISKDKEVNILIWEGFYPDEVFTEFEQETGIHVNISYVTNTDEILAKLLASNGDSEYDFIHLESAYVKPFVDNNLLEEIDYSNVPNSEDLYDNYWGIAGDEEGKYTCPDGTKGYTQIVYNKETCPIEIKQFQDLADPALKGQICSVNSTISLFGEALYALGYKPDSTTESEYQEAADLWTDIKSNVKLFTGASCYQSLENGECSVAFMFDYPVLMQNKDNWDKYEVADIDTPYETYSDTWGVPVGAKHKTEAEMLMNFLLEPEVMVERLEFYPQEPCSDKVKELVSDDILNNPAFNLPDTVVGDCWMVPVSDEQIALMDKYLTQFMSTDTQ